MYFLPSFLASKESVYNFRSRYIFQEGNVKRDRRIYKLKKPLEAFLCALCGIERQLKVRRTLSRFNYLQIFVTGICLSSFLAVFIGWKSLVVIPIVFVVCEFAHQYLYRKELPCPHCGFDAASYVKDVRVARTKVENFWNSQTEKNRPVLSDLK